MTPADRQAVATLAAAIVTSRGAKGAAELQSAWTDASWIVFPDAANPDYRTWQEKHQRVAGNTRTPSRPVHMNMGGKHSGQAAPPAPAQAGDQSGLTGDVVS